MFGLAALTGAAFWYIDGLMKGFQYRYYVRMREIEYTAYLINQVTLHGLYGEKKISAPRIDMTWDFKGFPVDDELKKLQRSSPPPPRLRRMLLWLSKRLQFIRSWLSSSWRRMLGLPERLERQRRHPQRDIQRAKESKGPEDPDYRASEPWRREPEEIDWDLRHRFRWANVMLPHVLAVVLGLLFFIVAAALNAANVDHLRL